MASCDSVGDKICNFTLQVSDKKQPLKGGETTEMVYFSLYKDYFINNKSTEVL